MGLALTTKLTTTRSKYTTKWKMLNLRERLRIYYYLCVEWSVKLKPVRILHQKMENSDILS